jgi:hypothetical protein
MRLLGLIRPSSARASKFSERYHKANLTLCSSVFTREVGYDNRL